MLNDLYGQEWSQDQNHFRPTFKLEKREKKDGKTMKIYEKKPQTPYPRLLASDAISRGDQGALACRTPAAGSVCSQEKH
jgi:hypothetical protein